MAELNGLLSESLVCYRSTQIKSNQLNSTQFYYWNIPTLWLYGRNWSK